MDIHRTEILPYIITSCSSLLNPNVPYTPAIMLMI